MSIFYKIDGSKKGRKDYSAYYYRLQKINLHFSEADGKSYKIDELVGFFAQNPLEKRINLYSLV